VDLADPADHGQMAVAVADVSLRARDAGDYRVMTPNSANGFRARSGGDYLTSQEVGHEDMIIS
jgi:hypothetical protein